MRGACPATPGPGDVYGHRDHRTGHHHHAAEYHGDDQQLSRSDIHLDPLL
jgi:hypothetical protein